MMPRKSALLAVLTIALLSLPACDTPPPDPPPGDPFARLKTGPDDATNNVFDYDIKLQYEWGANPGRFYHIVVEHQCQMMTRIGHGNPVLSRMHLAELWPLDENGKMPATMVDNIRRKPKANASYAEAHECCAYNVIGVVRTSGPSTIPSLPTSIALGALTAQGTPVRDMDTAVLLPSGKSVKASNDDNYYSEFVQNHGTAGKMKIKPVDPARQTSWKTEYALSANATEGFKMEGVTDGKNAGDQTPLKGCDFSWP